MTIKEIYDILGASDVPRTAEVKISAYAEYEDSTSIDFIYYTRSENIVVIAEDFPDFPSDEVIIYISDDIKQDIAQCYIDDKLNKLLNKQCNHNSLPSYEKYLTATLRNSITSYKDSTFAHYYKTAIERRIERNNNWINSIEQNIQALTERRKTMQSSDFKGFTVEPYHGGIIDIIYDDNHNCFIINNNKVFTTQAAFIDNALNSLPKQIDSIKAENAILTEELTKIKEVTE